MKIKWPKSVTIRAAIIGGGFVLVAAVITVIGPPIFNDNNKEAPAVPEEALVVSNVRSITDQPTLIHESFTFIEGRATTVKTGILSVFWEVLLSNNGVNDLSVINYEIVQIDEDFLSASYTHMEQGVYTLVGGELAPEQFPITIPAGNTKALFVRVGITMDEQAYQLVKEDFTSEEIVILEMIVNFLRLKELDFYGNPFTRDSAGVGVYSLPPIDEIREQVFGITFKTGRGTQTVGVLSWYKYGLFRNSMR